MRRWSACALAIGLWPWAARADTELSRWVRSRAEAYDAYFKSVHVPIPGQLWHERPAGEEIAVGFTGPVSLAPLIRAVRASVVNISSVIPPDGPNAPPHRAVGSGFVINPDGILITNNHVVDRAEKIHVRLADGRDLEAVVVGRDPSTDVALLKLDTDDHHLPFAFLGDSDQLQVGDWVVAIGNPFGLDHSVSHGMISAKERALGGELDDFIQTDALINQGNSGGPLFNMRGEVVGVNTSIIKQGQGIGFAVPINMVKDLIPNLNLYGRLERAWLGVTVAEQSAGPDRKGALVTRVFPGSPAAAAGIALGDRVMAVNSRPVESYLEMLRRISLLPPGTEVSISLTRQGVSREVTVSLGAVPAPEAVESIQGSQAGPLGLVVRDLTAANAQALGVPANAGVLVASVVPGTPADRAGLHPGDLILEINRAAIADTRGYREALSALGSADSVLLRYQRGEVIQYVAVRVD